MLCAFVDESARRRSSETTCVYTLAAVVILDDALDDVRQQMDSLRFGKTPRVHWREERPERRQLIAATVADLPLTSTVTVCLHPVETKTERARRLCLVRLLAELSDRGVDAVTFETRNEQDRADRTVLTNLRRSTAIRSDMSVKWLPPSDPALWVADVIAGSVSWWLNGDERPWNELENLVEMIDVDS